MTPDTLRPAMAINKEIDLRFVVGYTPLELRDTLHMLAAGKVDPRPLLTSTVGLNGVEAAFAALVVVGDQAKVLIDPSRHQRTRAMPVAPWERCRSPAGRANRDAR